MSAHPATALQPRKRPTRRDAQRTWEIILQAAAQVITRRGYAGTTTNHIAERAGLSIGTIYEYFPNKDVLLNELQSYWNDVCWTHQKKLPPVHKGLSFGLAVRRMMSNWLSILRLNPRLYAVLVHELPTRGNKWKADRRLTETVERIVCDLGAYPEVRAGNLRLTCEVLIRGIQNYLDHVVVEAPDRLRDPALVDELCRLVVDMLRGGDHSSRNASSAR